MDFQAATLQQGLVDARSAAHKSGLPGLELDPAWYRPFVELRCPLVGTLNAGSYWLGVFTEVPAVSSPGKGDFRARIDKRRQTIDYELSYEGTQGAVFPFR